MDAEQLEIELQDIFTGIVIGSFKLLHCDDYHGYVIMLVKEYGGLVTVVAAKEFFNGRCKLKAVAITQTEVPESIELWPKD